jgi:hypothetical protein
MANIIRGKDFKFYDELMSVKDALRDEFFAAHPNYENSDGVYIYKGDQYPTPESWKVYSVKYKFDGANDEVKTEAAKWEAIAKDRFPTAYALAKRFGDACPTACYAVLDAHSGLSPHSDIENIESKYICVHIGLDVPTGDCAFKVGDETIRWDDLFAYDNQVEHSAWNNTDNKRLIFLIDIDREICDL